MRLLFKIEFFQLTQILLLGLPYSVDYILNVQHKICLAVPGISEWHVRWIGLRNRSESKVRRPCLDQDHVASHQAGSVCSAPGICSAPEYHRSVIVRRITQDLVELDCESVQVADMQWTEVVVECIVQEGIIDSEVYRLWSVVYWCWPLLCSG